MSMKIRDNELCPCGSGKKYVECCKGKQAKINTSPKPPQVQIMEKMRSSMKRCCINDATTETCYATFFSSSSSFC